MLTSGSWFKGCGQYGYRGGYWPYCMLEKLPTGAFKPGKLLSYAFINGFLGNHEEVGMLRLIPIRVGMLGAAMGRGAGIADTAGLTLGKLKSVKYGCVAASYS